MIKVIRLNILVSGNLEEVNEYHLSDNQSKTASLVPFLIDWVEFRQEYLPVMSKDL